MKKKHYALVFAGIVLLMAIAYILQYLFGENTSNFGFSCGAYFLSLFCLACFQNALNPTESFGPINTTKRHYEKKGELPKYQNLCKILFIITISVGSLFLIGGIGEILFFYLKNLLVS